MSELKPMILAIYARLWALAAPIEPPPGPPSLPADYRFERRLVEFPTAALAQLGAQFLEAQQLTAGIAARDAAGELIPAPALRRPPVELVALRERDGEPPVDLLTPAGCLSGAPAALTMLRDVRLRGRIRESHGYLYLALAWDDLSWLEIFGLGAVYCPGADQLTVQLLRSLRGTLAATDDECEAPPAASPAGNILTSSPDESLAGPLEPAAAFAGEKDGELARRGGESCDGVADRVESVSAEASSPIGSESNENPRDHERRESAERPVSQSVAELPAVVIVAWSPGAWTCDAPPGLAAQLLTLAKVEQVLVDAYAGLDLIVWSPNCAELERLDVVRRHSSAERLRQAVAESVEMSGRMLSALAIDAPPQNYCEARAALRSLLMRPSSGGVDESELQAARSRFDHFLQAEMIHPLLQRVAGQVDPRERVRNALTAELCEQFFQLAPLATAEICQARFCGGALQYMMHVTRLLSPLVGRRE